MFLSMNKYIQKPDEVIDLHGYTGYEAEQVLQQLILQNEYRHVRIIVGKGQHSSYGPVLPDVVKAFLNIHHITYRQSKIQDGGAGALEVFL